MSNFSKTSVWVFPSTNTLPTTGSSENLAKGQVGIFKDNARTAATAANIGTADFIQIIQGRNSDDPRGSKYSSKIKASAIKKYYKVEGNATAAVEIGQFSGFSAKCDETLSLTLRGFSSYLQTLDPNGFTRSLVIRTPCCECGAEPCETVDNEDIIDLFIEAARDIQAVQSGPSSLNINTYYVFEKIGTGDEAVLKVTAKPLDVYGRFCDITLNPYEYDRMWFKAWAYKQPDSTIDFYDYDLCDQVATWTYLQRSTYPSGTYDQVYQDEIDYNSYLDIQKFNFTNSVYNQWLDTYAEEGVLYDSYYIISHDIEEGAEFNSYIHQQSTAILHIPQSLSSAVETILAAYLPTIADKTGPGGTTSTTTSTTTTSTTSTTIFVP